MLLGVIEKTEHVPSRSSRPAPRLRLTSSLPPSEHGDASSHSASGHSEGPEEEVGEPQAQGLQAAGATVWGWFRREPEPKAQPPRPARRRGRRAVCLNKMSARHTVECHGRQAKLHRDCLTYIDFGGRHRLWM